MMRSRRPLARLTADHKPRAMLALAVWAAEAGDDVASEGLHRRGCGVDSWQPRPHGEGVESQHRGHQVDAVPRVDPTSERRRLTQTDNISGSLHLP
jgi:hypothetical protein